MKIAIINGPNLNLLGTRENDIYGNRTFTDFLNEARKNHPKLEINYFQSNIEGELIDAIQRAGKEAEGVILNAAAYTHTSIGISDAVRAVGIPVIEVHISNTFSREEYRHKSFISAYTRGVIVGFGLDSYELALLHFERRLR